MTDMESGPAPALRVLLVDDEAPARSRLRTLLGECTVPPARVVGEAVDAAQARAWLVDGRCDLVLLDIALPGQSGLVLAAELRAAASPSSTTAPAIVFVTAHADHAVLAFELDAADYLTKPVRRERLQAALHRVALRHPAVAAAVGWASLAAGSTAAEAAAPNRGDVQTGDDTDPVIVVHDRGRILRVPVAEVIYLRAELKYLTLRTRTDHHVLDGTLGDFEQRLGSAFLRIHRNALVARRAVRALERAAPTGEAGDGGAAADGWTVRLHGLGDRLPVSRRQLSHVRAALTRGAAG